jgi:hypothetical protein
LWHGLACFIIMIQILVYKIKGSINLKTLPTRLQTSSNLKF